MNEQQAPRIAPSRSASGLPAGFEPQAAGEEAWIEVIHKMDAVYCDLVESQTKLEHQNAALEEAQRFIANLLGSMTDAVVACDNHGRITKVNAAMVELSGVPESRVLGHPITEVLADPQCEASKNFLHDVIIGHPIRDVEIDVRDGKGGAAPLAVNGSPMLNYRGQRIGMALVGRPVGELRRAYRALDLAHQSLTRTQQQLVVSEKMAALGRVVAGVAHELNNPISFIFGNMHALNRYCEAITRYLDVRPDETGPDGFATLRQALKIDAIAADIGPLIEGTMEGAERVRAIVEDLRRFSSNQREQPETFNISRVIRTAVEWVLKAERIKPAVELDLPENLEATLRKGHLHQVMVNLVQNAFDVIAGRPDPKVVVHVRAERDTVVIEVADNGAGIPRSNLDRIFEPFFTTKPIGKGTGLGLYVSYGLIKEQGGDLTAANRPEGGASFTIRLPMDSRNGRG
jgi:two-component system sensor histidine kinase HupT/HoxJ